MLPLMLYSISTGALRNLERPRMQHEPTEPVSTCMPVCTCIRISNSSGTPPLLQQHVDQHRQLLGPRSGLCTHRNCVIASHQHIGSIRAKARPHAIPAVRPDPHFAAMPKVPFVEFSIAQKIWNVICQNRPCIRSIADGTNSLPVFEIV